MEGGDEESRKSSIRMTGVTAEVRTGHLTNGNWSLTGSDLLVHREMVLNKTLGGLASSLDMGGWRGNSKQLLIRLK
jgi:hypothetical protein